MPSMDGFEFLDDFLNFPINKTENCTVVMLTSSNNQKDIERSKQYPIIKKYLKKPITLLSFNEILSL